MTADLATDDTTPAAATRAGRPVPWLCIFVVAVPVVVFAVMAWQRRWMADDGFINLRVVDQLKAGHGPVFNRGERVETVTSPLWVYVLTVADVLAPLRSEWVAVLLGIACAVAGVVLAMLGASRLTRPRTERLGDAWPLPVGILLVIAVSPAWDFASAGLEIGLVFLWLAACLFGLATWAQRGERAPLWLFVLLGVGPLIRPDFLLFSLVFLAAALLGDRTRSSAGRGVASVLAWLALPGAYEIFRMGYYGALVPNTAFAKAADQSSYRAGWHYVTNLVGTYWLWVPIAIVIGAVAVPLLRTVAPDDGARRARVVMVAFIVAALLHAAYIVRVGGDYMHGRLLLPALFAFAAPFAVVWMPRARWSVAVLAALSAWALVAGIALRAPESKFGDLTWDDRRLISQQTKDTHPVLASRRYGASSFGHLQKRLYVGASPSDVAARDIAVNPDVPLPAIMTYAVGATGYLAGVDTYIVDRLGLGDVFTAHLQLTGRGFPGHEKSLPAHYAIARIVRPGTPYDPKDFAVSFIAEWRRGMTMGQLNAYLRRRDAAVPLDERVAEARRVLQCKDVRRLLDTARAPLTAKRFLTNLVDSVRTYGTEIPWEPSQAIKKLC